MRTLTWPAAFARLDDVEVRLCLPVNAIGRYLPVRGYFAAVSRLGDGIAWYALMAALLLVHRNDAVLPVLHMIGVGLVCTVTYKWLKARTLRPRPYQVHQSIRQFTAPLDRFSFPSGHTLHAAAFTLIAAGHYPELTAALTVFSALVAASRVVLGLHYPSDVVAGAAIGATIALASQALIG